jgi:putative transposase
VKRAYKMRAYPTRQQQSRANELLADHCDLYNAALEERSRAWDLFKQTPAYHLPKGPARKAASKPYQVSYGHQSAQMRELRELCPEQARWSFTAQQQTLRRLNRAFDGFFSRVEAGQTPGYPRYRSRGRFDTVDHQNGDGAKWTPTQGRWARAYFMGVGTLKVSEHTHIQGRVTQVSLKREHGGRRWYVIVIAESDPVPLPATGRSVGIDMGVARFLTTSDGEIVANPRFLESAAEELAELQRQKALCKKGSGNYRRLNRRIAKLHRLVANRRRDFHHQVAHRLVNECDAIAWEDLKIKNMTRSAKGTVETPGTNVAAKSGLNRVLLDVGMAQFLGIVEAKVRQHEPTRAGHPVNPRRTSKDCPHPRCGLPCLRPQQDTIVCPTHGELDADWAAATNIYTRAGLGSGEAAQAA